MYAVILLLICALSGCTPQYSDFFPYTDRGIKKPSLTLLPIYDTTGGSAGSNFSTELYHSIYSRIRSKGVLFIPPQQNMKRILASMQGQNLYASSDLSLLKRFSGTDYICLMEVVDYRTAPYKRGTIKPLYIADLPEEKACVLSIEVKLKIVDMRSATPKVVRQEVVESNHMISTTAFEGNSTAHGSSLEQVQSRLARDLTDKIEETLCSAN
ncbi:MAG: hypothetical protein JSR46_02875 [Verrucomicrobia bacterium]|nr:hypothetical protein [Verrucomicrobiota bacterium]